MEVIDDGVVYIDVMTWLLSSNPTPQDVVYDRRMLEDLSKLLIHLRLDLIDRLVSAMLHSQKLWSIRIDDRPKPGPFPTDGINEINRIGPMDQPNADLPRNETIEPFRTIFLKLKFACWSRLQRSTLTHSSPSDPTDPTGFDVSHPSLPKLKPLAIKFIERWRNIVSHTEDCFQKDHSIHLSIRRLFLIAVLFASSKSFDLSSSSSALCCSPNSRLRSSIELDCVNILEHSISQHSPSRSTTFNETAITLDSKSIVTWLAVQLIPSMNSVHLTRSSANLFIASLADSLFGVFQNGNIFNDLSASLEITPQSVHLRPSSVTYQNLKKVSVDPLGQVVLSTSLSISKLIENTIQTPVLESFSVLLMKLVQIIERMNRNWSSATSSCNLVTLPKFREDVFSVDQSKLDEYLADRWLKTIFFCCLLILGGLANWLSKLDCPQQLWPSLLKSGFQIFGHLHFVTLRFPSDKLSMHTAVLKTFVQLSRTRKQVVNDVLKQCQPAFMKPGVMAHPVEMSKAIYYFNLIETFSGSMIEPNYLEQVMVPLVFNYLEQETVRFHALVGLIDLWQFCSSDTVLSLADKYFEILTQDIALGQASILSPDQHRRGWQNLLKSISKHSKSKTEELTGKLIGLIKDIDPPLSPDQNSLSPSNQSDHQAHDPAIERRKKLYKLVISQIGELSYEPSPKEMEAFLDLCWYLIKFEDDLIELFEVGLNHQSLKITNSHHSNFGIHWWLQKKIDLNHQVPSKL